MDGERGIAAWSSEAWRRRAMDWVDRSLAAAGLHRTGEPQPASLRPWAAVFRVPASGGGPVWLKASGAHGAFEPALYELLARVAPERVLAPLAADAGRGWLLLPDGGPSLRERARGRELADAIAAALPRYAELQRAVAPHAGELLRRGVPDMRPEAMPARFDEALDVVRAYAERHGGDGARAAVDRVAGMRATVVSWCEQLAGGPVPASLDHNDLHASNILAGPRFLDWGDGVVAHPFASMLALGWIRRDATDVIRLRDAYLEPFGDVAPHARLVEALELACRVGKVARALTWHSALSAARPGDLDPSWLSGPAESLFSLLEDSWLGRA